jgi:hypothetical protein
MTKPKSPLTRSEETLEELLDIVANAREELIAVERRLEQLRGYIAEAEKQKNGPREPRIKNRKNGLSAYFSSG